MMSIGVVLTMLFMVLKLSHQVQWAWLWVLLPLLLQAGLDVVVLFLGGFALLRWVLRR